MARRRSELTLETGVHRFNLNFPRVLFLQLEAVAKRRGLSVTDIIRAAIELELEIDEQHVKGDVLGLRKADGSFWTFTWPGARYARPTTLLEESPEETQSGIANLNEGLEIMRSNRPGRHDVPNNRSSIIKGARTSAT